MGMIGGRTMKQLIDFFINRFNTYGQDTFVWIILICFSPLVYLLGIVVLDWDSSFESKMERIKFYQGATIFTLFLTFAYCGFVYLLGFRPALGNISLNNFPFLIIAGTSLGLALISLVLMYVVEGYHRYQYMNPSSEINKAKRRP